MQYSEKADEWRQIIMNCQNSGLTNRQYCEEIDVKIHTYYYWMRRLRKMACAIQEKILVPQANSPQAIVPLLFHNEGSNLLKLDQSSTAVILHLISIVMEFRNGASESIIRNTIQALKLC